MKAIRPFLPYIIAIFVGLILSQLPLIANKYDQALGVEIDRIDIALRSLDADAEQRRMDRFDYIKQLQNEGDIMQQELAENHLDLISRRQVLVNAEKLFTQNNGGDAFLKLMLYFDGPTFVQAIKFYSPGFALTLSWIGHFIVGILLGIICNFLPFFFRTREVPIPAEVHLENEDENDGFDDDFGGNFDGFGDETEQTNPNR